MCAATAERDDENTPLPELLLGSVGLLLTVALLAFFGYQALFVRDGGPDLRASVTSVQGTADGQYVVEYEVANHGGVTAESVTVVGELVRDGEQVEQVSSTVDYVPIKSSRSGGLVFSEDPGTGSLNVRATSYTRP